MCIRDSLYTNQERTREELIDATRNLINHHYGLTTTQFTEFADRPDINPSVQDLFAESTFADFDYPSNFCATLKV